MIRVVAAAMLLASGCAAATSSCAAPPTKICGTTLDTGASGAVVWDATRASGQLPIVTGTSATGLYIRVAPGCDTGALVSWAPRNQARILREADAADGNPVVVVLQPTSHEAAFTVSGTTNGHRVAWLRVDLRRGETPQPSPG